jgi:hypothetical protein
MNTHTNKTQENKSHPVATAVSHKQSNRKSTFQFEDNRPEIVIQRKMQVMANKNTSVNNVVQLVGFGLGEDIVNPVMVETGLGQVPTILIHPDHKRALPMITDAMAKLNNDHRHIELAMKIQLLTRIMENPNVTDNEFGNIRHAVSGLLKELNNKQRLAVMEYEYERKQRLNE